MKKLFVLLLTIALLHIQLFAQSRNISFQFEPGTTSGISDVTGMEKNISKLLTAINVACVSGKTLSFTGISIDTAAQKNLRLLWENMHFYCEDDVNVGKCLHDFQGIQVRDISITLKPIAEYEGSLERELTVSLTKNGVITGARMALSNNQYKDVMMEGSTVTETRERMEILKFVEDFRCYYNEKNIAALRQVYAEDALIISGCVMQTKKTNIDVPPTIKYRRENKTEYLTRMENLFKRKKYIDVDFDRITIVKHGTKPQYYGVTLHQDWKTDNYKDEGWLFLLWDFTDRDHPVIHVRTWQPNEAAEKDGIFDLNDFFL